MSQRDDAREILRELLNEALAVPNGNGIHGAVPQVPAPLRSCGRRTGPGRPPAAR